MKIKTEHAFPNLTDVNHDWSAVDDDVPESPHGHGPTERKAIFDLMMQIFPDETLSFIQKITDVHQRIIERDRLPIAPRKLNDDEFDDDMFSQENGDGSIY